MVAGAVALAALTACAQPRIIRETVVEVQTVDRPVAVACVPDTLGRAPLDYVDSDSALLAAEDGAERFQRLAMGRDQRSRRLEALEAVIEGCR